MSAGQSSVEVVVLGSGTSHGVPMIGCRCPVCTSDDPRDKRMRPSVYVQAGGKKIIIDTTPELRLQCLAAGIDELDAVLFTHHHADHVTGLDDLRRFNWIQGSAVPCYGTEQTLSRLRRMFRYAFDPEGSSVHSCPELHLHTIDSTPFRIGEETITPIPLMHGPLPVLGFRIGPFAYCTDCSAVPEESMPLLGDLAVLMLDAVRLKPHPAHFSLDQAVETARTIAAKKTYFTHIAHGLKHAETNRSLPDGMELAYDGLHLELP